MSSLAASLLVIGLPAAVIVLGAYWYLRRINSGSEQPKPMTMEQVQYIESQLGVTLPIKVRTVLCSERPTNLDSTTLIDDPERMIKETLRYRAGFSSLPPWPSALVYLGDQSDACPYALDCTDGSITYLDHGDLTSKPLDRFPSIDEFCASFDD